MVPVPVALHVVSVPALQVVAFGRHRLHRGPVVMSEALQPEAPHGVGSSALPSALHV